MKPTTFKSLLPENQLLTAGIAMLLAFAVLDQYLLAYQAAHPAGILKTTLLLAVFVAQIGVMGALCVRLVQQSWLSWVLYGCCWLLVDAQSFAAGSYASGTEVRTESVLSTALLAAQVALVVIWGVLGKQPWTIRLPVLLGLGAVVAVLLGQRTRDYYDDYSQLFLVQVFALLAICLFLRWRGFHIGLARRPEHVAFELPPPGRQLQIPRLDLSRLGVQHVVIIAGAGLALILAVFHAANLFNAPLTGRNEPLNVATASMLIALTLIAALWAALSASPFYRRIGLLAATCGVSAVAFAVTDALFGPRYYHFNNHRGALQFWWHVPADRGWMFAWMSLAAGLLFAALLPVRMLGYRLCRRAVALVPVEELKWVATWMPDGGYALLSKGRDGLRVATPADQESERMPIPRFSIRELAMLAVIMLLVGLWSWDHFRQAQQVTEVAKRMHRMEREASSLMVISQELRAELQKAGYDVNFSIPTRTATVRKVGLVEPTP